MALRPDNNELVQAETRRIDEQLQAADDYRQTDKGLADQARLYADEIAEEKRIAAIAAKLPEGWEESIDNDEKTSAEIAKEAGVTEDEVDDAYYADAPEYTHLWNVEPKKNGWEQ